jgi:hypothetical protein
MSRPIKSIPSNHTRDTVKGHFLWLQRGFNVGVSHYIGIG